MDFIPEILFRKILEWTFQKNYYAWTWGDALFIVLDVYRTECHDTLVAKPQGWNWTLGQSQYNWLLNTFTKQYSALQICLRASFAWSGSWCSFGSTIIWMGRLSKYRWQLYFCNASSGLANVHPWIVCAVWCQYFFRDMITCLLNEVLDSVTYQEVPMAADSPMKSECFANADAYTADTWWNRSPSCHSRAFLCHCRFCSCSIYLLIQSAEYIKTGK